MEFVYTIKNTLWFRCRKIHKQKEGYDKQKGTKNV